MNDSLKIIFFGTGSIGSRHIRLLAENFPQHKLYSFVTVNGSDQTEKLYSWDAVQKVAPDIAFICNPTHLHIKTAIACLHNGMHVFMEKPIGSDLNRLGYLEELTRETGKTVYVAYPFRFHPVIIAAKSKCLEYPIVSCLTDSATWRNGRITKQLGGGAMLELSHEIDIANYLCGDCDDIQIQDINILDGLDCMTKIMLFKGGCGVVGVCIGTIIATKYHLRRIVTDNGSYDYSPNDQIYIDQLHYFFDNINNPMLMNNIHDASKLYRNIIHARESAYRNCSTEG